MEWRNLAQCRIEGTDPELFFSATEIGPGLRQTMTAKAVCGRCPVRAECLRDALDAHVEYGVFGGLSASERRDLARSRHWAPVMWHRPVAGVFICAAYVWTDSRPARTLQWHQGVDARDGQRCRHPCHLMVCSFRNTAKFAAASPTRSPRYRVPSVSPSRSAWVIESRQSVTRF